MEPTVSPLTAEQQIELIRKALDDGLVLDRFVGSVPIFHRTPETQYSEVLPPLIDGCRILLRGDGYYVCRSHFRYWNRGPCPGRFPSGRIAIAAEAD